MVRFRVWNRVFIDQRRASLSSISPAIGHVPASQPVAPCRAANGPIVASALPFPSQQQQRGGKNREPRARPALYHRAASFIELIALPTPTPPSWLRTVREFGKVKERPFRPSCSFLAFDCSPFLKSKRRGRPWRTVGKGAIDRRPVDRFS